MRPITIPKFIMPRIITAFLVVCVLGLGIVYILYQARFLIIGPQIVLTEEPTTLQNARKITLSGTTENITAIFLNDRPIVTNEEGVFKESIVLENGYTVVSLRANDRYGRDTTIERAFVYAPYSQIY